MHQAWRVLRAALSAAQRDELVHRNVASLVRMPVPRSDKATIWTAEQAAQFLASADADEDPLYAAYVLLLVLGLRKGEVLAIAWEDIDLERKQASIRWQLQRFGGRLQRTRTKTRTSEAVLPLPDVCVAALRRRRIEQDREAAARGEAWHDSGRVFTSSHGTPVDPRNFFGRLRSGLPRPASRSSRSTRRDAPAPPYSSSSMSTRA